MGGYGGSYDYSKDDKVVKKSAASYNIKHKRAYEQPKEKKRLPPPLDKVLITKAKFPLVVGVDVTGSMRTLPQLIFDKLCILYNEVLYFLPKELKDSFEVSFAAIGDAYSDAHPLQITDFAKAMELDQNIKSIYPEGGGGGGYRETYELLAYFYSSRCEMPDVSKNVRPMLVFIGDEAFYAKVNRGQIKSLMGDPPKTDLVSNEVFEELRKKFDVYILRIEYRSQKEDEEIHAKWVEALGKDRVIMLRDPKRVVDTILGLVAANVDQFDKFKERIEIRQTPEQVDQVFSTLDGLKTEKKSYVYEFQVLKCPSCGENMEEAPEHNKPKKCPFCGVIIVRI